MSTPLLGTGYGLFIDTVTAAATNTRGTEANYKLVACGVTNGLDVNAAEVTTSNKCDGGYASSLSGLIDWSFTFDGQAVSIVGETSSKVNYQTLLGLMLNKTVFFAKLANPDDDTYIREGKVRISTMSESLPNQDVYTVNATFVGIGELFIEPVVTP